MKGSVRYIITRPCLSEGSVRLLKYLDSIFPADGGIILRDDRGGEHHARVDRRAGRIFGLHDLYHRHNLGVNDVLLITPLGEDRYQVECVVKPVTDRSTTPARLREPIEKPQRVVVSESKYVREVRMERRTTTTGAPGADAAQVAPERNPSNQPATLRAEPTMNVAPSTQTPMLASTNTRPAPAIETARPQSASAPALTTDTNANRAYTAIKASEAERTPISSPMSASAPASTLDGEGMLRELSARVGYRFERLTDGVVRLRADLGTQSYAILIALNLDATSRPEWREDADYLAVLVSEDERPQGLPRLTREALAALLENARLAPLTPIELRGYWNAGSFDLESAASVAELVSAQLSQRGVFSFVLMSLAQQPAHSVVSASRLAERLGSGVNIAELNSVLQTLASAPFSALSPIGSGQYYLRADVHEVLRGLSEYAEGLRVRLTAETRVGVALR